MHAPSWNDLRLVLLLMRHGTFSSAARPLGVDESTVKRRLERAEQRLGTRLFDRVRGKLEPTDAARTLAEHAGQMEALAERAAEAVAGGDAAASGRVRLSTVPVIANRILIPSLPALSAHAPRLCLQLIAEPQNLSLMARETDIALRLSRPEGEQAVRARKVTAIPYAVYGQSCNLPWITYEDRLRDLPQTEWIWERLREAEDEAPLLEVSDAESVLAALREGLGKSLLPVAVGSAEPGVTRLSSGVALKREAWLLIHPDLAGLRRVRIVCDWVETVLRTAGRAPCNPPE